MLRYYSAIIGSVVELDVSDELEREIRRSYWREAKSRERFLQRCLPLEEGYGFEEDKDSSIEAIIVHNEAIEALKQVLETLTDRQRQAVQCLYYDELSLTETAHILGISVPRMSQYHKRLKEIIKQRFIELYF